MNTQHKLIILHVKYPFINRVQVKGKQSSSGVILGEDVLSLRVEALPQINHLLIMALVIVYGLIQQQL